MSKRWAFVALLLAQPAMGQAVSPKVALAEKKRVEVINKVKPSVVAVMARDLRGNLTGNGSGVLIDDEGYCLTNWHVTSAARTPLLKCGLPDGHIYDAVLVGLDKVGDVALIKLLPKNDGDKFPFAKLGDSDEVKAGDWSLAMGNPFSLATDFTPTVTFGLISGMHRYQYPAGTLLEYTDCIQIDTSINPGNSGGPLFNMNAELIGINGRGSFEKRGRVNSGVGYAISINQIKNFMGHLRAGLDTDHASIGASMESEGEDVGLNRIVVKNIIESDAKRRGLEVGDQLVSFGGRPMNTVNQFKNVLGLFPRGWKMPVVYRRDNQRHEMLVRLMGVQRELFNENQRPNAPPRPQPDRPNKKPQPGPAPSGPSPPSAKLYKYQDGGYANYYFNELAQKRVLDNLTKLGDFTKQNGDWTLRFSGKMLAGLGSGKNITSVFLIKDKGAAHGKSPKVIGDIDGLDFPLEPLNVGERPDAFKDPPESGGFVLGVFAYRQLLSLGAKGFTREFHHGGIEPYYPPTKEDKPDFAKIRVMAEVLRGKYAHVDTRWYFAVEDDKEGRWKKGQLIGFEVTPDKDEDPCEVCLSGYRDYDGRQLPANWFVRRGGRPYVELKLDTIALK